MDDKTRKPRSGLRGWWWKLPLGLIGLALVADAIGVLGPAGLPACDSANAKGTLKAAFDGSQFARNLGLSAIEVRAANAIFGKTRLPFRLPTIAGGLGTGVRLRMAFTPFVARFAVRSVPILGELLLVVDAARITACTIR